MNFVIMPCDLIKSTGAFIRNERIYFIPEKIEYKGHNDMVSYVDKTAEKNLVEGLISYLPEIGLSPKRKQ